MDKCCEGSYIGRVEDNNYMLYLRAVLLDVVTELGSNLTVAFQKVFACHSVLAGSTT